MLARRQFMALGAAGLASACSLPRGAARPDEILSSAAKAPGGGYAIHQVTRDFLPVVRGWPMTGSGPRGGWITHSAGAGSNAIAPGDRLDITVWDSGADSLLTAPGEKLVALDGVTVAPDGSIFLPYAERVPVSGLSPQEARERIQARMEAVVPSAQVQLGVQAGRGNSADLVGGVADPGPYPLPGRDTTVLNLLSMGGGVLPELENPILRLIRGGRVHVTTLARLYADPRMDSTLRGGDKIIVEEDPRHFLAIGAAGSERMIQFTRDRVSALDAVALMGGLSDATADPRALLILREYPASATRGDTGPAAPRVIFVLDTTTADGLFSARRFAINPDDVVYASESALTDFRSVTGVIGSVFGLTRRAGNL